MRNIYPLQRTRAWRTYTGGAKLNSFFGQPDICDSHYPEEWILSVVEARNVGRPQTDPPEGLSLVADSGLSFRDLLASAPERLLGKKHVGKFGTSLGVLVKLIDSAERLTIQVHPTRKAAQELFNSPFGKTECWHILGGREINGEKPCIYFGFKPGITAGYWKDVFEKQNIPAMLDCLHRFNVKPGDTFLIEGGIPHAIGAGCFLIEIQEPTDYTIRTERVTPAGLTIADEGCHQGLGFDRMFDCFSYEGISREETEEKWKINRNGNCIISLERSACFELNEITINNSYELTGDGGFLGIFILEGKGTVSDSDASYPVQKGNQLFIAASAEKVTFATFTPMHILTFKGPK